MASLTVAVQQNLLVLLAFDKSASLVIRGIVEVPLYEGMYQEIVSKIYEYIDKYKRPPNDHLADLFDKILEDKSNKKRKPLKQLLIDIYDQRHSINAEYTLSRVTDFVREQRLKTAVIEAAEILQSGDEDAADRVSTILDESTKFRLNLFDPGIRLSDASRGTEFLDPDESDVFITGIKEFDRIGVGPARKEMFLVMAPAKRGKTWFLCQLGKLAVLSGKKVVHITLEMSAKKMAQRYYQTMFDMSKRKERHNYLSFKRDSLDRLTGVDIQALYPSLSQDDPRIKRKLKKKIKLWGPKFSNFIIKEFPSGQLTLQMLEAYLDNLEAAEGFIPDLVIVDYPELMKLDINNYRLAISQLFVDLRGVAGERNLAMAVASQSNRTGAGSKTVDETHTAEAFAKIGTVDNVVTYSQTASEKELGCARLFLSNGRNDADRITVLVSQNYATGQFVLDSIPLFTQRSIKGYFDLVKEEVGEVEDDDD
tara:strand:- start:15888 stop:17327 length:1440 start_codon:yes stop_codon:yes gene_type:complete